MSTFNGPAHAAEALSRIQFADDASSRDEHEVAAHHRETAAVYAALAALAARLEEGYGTRNAMARKAWETALATPQQ